MAWRPELYPASWSQIRKEALIRANYQCEVCHARRGDEAINLKTKEKYLVYLSVAHRVFYYHWKHDADTIVLCQRHHNAYDSKFRKRGKLSVQTPIGHAKVYLPQEDGKMVLISACRTYIELLLTLDVLAPGQVFEVHLEINTRVVGVGVYARTTAGVDVIAEDGYANMFSAAFMVIPESVKPLPVLAHSI